MTLKPPLIAAMFLVAIGTAVARAETASINVTTYLRAGPGILYPALDEALSDERVDVIGCADGWCHVTYGDASGYVSQGALGGPRARLVQGEKTCFVNRIAGYHGGPDVEFCYAPPAR